MASRKHHLQRNAEWMEDARCVGMDPELFFLESRGGNSQNVMKVKQFCAACPVRLECALLGFAVGGGDGVYYGIYGGLTPVERMRLKKWARQLDVPIEEMVPFFEDFWKWTERAGNRSRPAPSA